MLQSKAFQRIEHEWATEQQQQISIASKFICILIFTTEAIPSFVEYEYND